MAQSLSSRLGFSTTGVAAGSLPIVGMQCARCFQRQDGDKARTERTVPCQRSSQRGPESGMERVAGIEPAYSAWKAAALPLSYTRIAIRNRGWRRRCQAKDGGGAPSCVHGGLSPRMPISRFSVVWRAGADTVRRAVSFASRYAATGARRAVGAGHAAGPRRAWSLRLAWRARAWRPAKEREPASFIRTPSRRRDSRMSVGASTPPIWGGNRLLRRVRVNAISIPLGQPPARAGDDARRQNSRRRG